MSLIVIGISHRTAPVTLREQFAIAEARVPEMLAQLRQEQAAEEAVILSTCNRVEIYAASHREAREAFAGLQAFLVRQAGCTEPVGDAIYRLAEPHSIEHLFKVASGLDSMVLGETEILGQLKKAYDLALQHRHTGSRLNKVFQKAFNVAKLIRTDTSIQRGSVSVASVGVELAERVFSALNGRQVLVIGAGDTSEKAARALLSRGAQGVAVTNRTHERAVALAAALGGRAVPFESWAEEFPKIDIVISSTAAPRHILDRARLEPLMRLRPHRPLLLIDLAVPRDIDPEVNFLDDVYLYNIDDLQAIADDYLKQRQAELARCEAIIRDKARRLVEPHPAEHWKPGSSPAFGHD